VTVNTEANSIFNVCTSSSPEHDSIVCECYLEEDHSTRHKCRLCGYSWLNKAKTLIDFLLERFTLRESLKSEEVHSKRRIVLRWQKLSKEFHIIKNELSASEFSFRLVELDTYRGVGVDLASPYVCHYDYNKEWEQK
jgi:hypothetical protein